jgi:hypothetical protein
MITLMVLTGLAVAYGLSNAPRAVYLTAPTLGTAADAEALDAIVQHTMDASSFTRHTQGETLIYQAPNRTEDEEAYENDPSSFATAITLGSKEYDLLGQPLGQAGCWVESALSSHNAAFGRPYAISNLAALFGYRTALRRSDHFTVEKIVPATLQSVTPIGVTLTTSQKAYKQAVRDRRAVEAYLHSKGQLRITTTVTTKDGFVAGVAVMNQGRFVTADNKVVSSGLNLSYTYGHFNSSPPIDSPPANDVLNTSPNGQFTGDGSNGLGTCGSSLGVFPVKGATTAVQNQYLTLNQPLLAANDAFVNAVIPHYKTTLNANAKRLGAPLVATLAKANMELAGDTWPRGVQASIDHLIKARKTFIAAIENLPSTGHVTTAWTRKLYDDGAAAGNIEDTILRDLGLPINDSS